MRFTERELWVDQEHILLARDHRGIHVVSIGTSPGMYGQREFGRLSKGRQRGAENSKDNQKIKTKFRVSHSDLKPPVFQAKNDSGAMQYLQILSIKMREI